MMSRKHFFSHFILFLILITSSPLTAQENAVTDDIQVFVCVASKKTIKDTRKSTFEEMCQEWNTGGIAYLQSNPDTSKTSVQNDDFILIKVTDGSGNELTASDHVTLIRARAANSKKDIMRRTQDDESSGIIRKKYMGLPLNTWRSIDNGERVTVEIYFNNILTPVRRYALFSNTYEPYSSRLSLPTIWFPVGLVATQFKSGVNGIPATALPISVASGGKLFLSKASDEIPNFYLGASMTLGWAWLNSSVETPVSTMMSQEDDTVGFLKGVSAGGIIDISDYVYIGGSYVFDFREGYKNPGFVAVFGLGPGLISLLK